MDRIWIRALSSPSQSILLILLILSNDCLLSPLESRG
jgi:hypothetical protein